MNSSIGLENNCIIRYRITKYNPLFRDSTGAYQKDDWTSCFDIGISFSGVCFSSEDYLNVEEAYIRAIEKICEVNCCSDFVADQIEKAYEIAEVKKMMENIGLPISKRELFFYKSMTAGACMLNEDMLLLSKMILRELLWGKVVSLDRNIIIEFGYDYYMYITCPILSSEHIKYIERLGLYVEKSF